MREIGQEETIKIDRGKAEKARRRLPSGSVDGVEQAPPQRRRARNAVRPSSSTAAPAPKTPVIGYASCVRTGRDSNQELKQQATIIARECEHRGLQLLEVVGEPATRKGLGRPGLTYALDRIRSGEARGLVVAELSRITHSAAELGTILEWMSRSNVRLVAPANCFDTECGDGQLAADVLIEVSRWERARLSQQTRNGLQAARLSGKSTGRGAVTDDPDLIERIAQMRAQGMTLQAIADRLNEEGVPTVRGGAKWRHSSVQAAVGYRRQRQHPNPLERMTRQPSADKHTSG